MVGFKMSKTKENRKFRKCIHNKIEEICQTLSEISTEATEIIKECRKDQETQNGRKSDERETSEPGSKARIS